MGRTNTRRTIQATVRRGRLLRRTGVVMAVIAVGALVLPAVASVVEASPVWAPPTAPTTAKPFNECPNVAGDTAGCGLLIVLNASGTPTITASGQGPYDGHDDTTVGVLNKSGVAIASMALTSTLDIFGFDGDGVCSDTTGHHADTYALDWSVTDATSADYTNYTGPVAATCTVTAAPDNYGPTGITFSNLASNNESGTVNFAGGLANGASAFFSLENSLTSASFTIPQLTSFTTTPSSTSIVYGSSVTDTATLTGTSGVPATPSGTVNFYVCGPTSGLTSCSSTANQVGSAITLVSGAATSAEFTPSVVGTYCFYAVYNGTNYLSAAESGGAGAECFDVTPAPLTITASSGTMTAGGTPPTITPTFSNVKAGDTSTSLASATTQPTCSTTATSSSAPGTYTSSCTGAVDPNYSSIIYVSGTVTVTAASTSSNSSSTNAKPATAGASSSSAVSGATAVHTGMPFAGSRPYVAAVGALGLGMLGLGMVRRRRHQVAVRHRR